MMREDHVATDKLRLQISGTLSPLSPEQAAELHALIRSAITSGKKRGTKQAFRKPEFPAEVEDAVLADIGEIIVATQQRLADEPPAIPSDEAARLKLEAEKQAAIEAQAERVREAARRVAQLGRLRSKPKDDS